MNKRLIISIAIIEILTLSTCQRAVFAESEREEDRPPKKAAAKTLVTPLELIEGIFDFDLGKLVVTPTKYEKYLRDVTVSTSVTDQESFERGDFFDVSGPLDRVNSVRIERYGSPGQPASAVIRGLGGGRILVLIDGMPYNAPSQGRADLEKIPLSKVKKIEVVRGPYSSLYGADAVGGVINIITKDVPKETMIKASYSFGSWNTHNVTVESGSTYGKLGYGVILNYLYTDGARPHSDHSAFDITSKVKLDILKDADFTFYANYHLARTEQPGSRPALLLKDRSPSQRRLGNDDVSSLFDYGRTSRIHLNSKLNIKNFTADLYFIYWNDDNHTETIDSGDWLVDNDEYMTYIYGMEYKYAQEILKIDTITIGASFARKVFKVKDHQFNENTFTHTFDGRDAVRREWSIYGENELRLYPFTINFGLRRDDPSDYSIQWSPKISGLLELGFGTKVRSSYAKAYRAPTLNDINWPRNSYAEGNPDLLPEKTESWEIGVEKLFKDVLLVKAGFFRQRIHNAIVWAPTGSIASSGFPRWRPSNVNKLMTKGVELETRLNISKELQLSLDYTYLDPVEVVEIATNPPCESRRLAPNTPRHKFYGGVEWKKPFGIEGLIFDSFLRFISERRDYYGTPPEKKMLDHYFLWDAKARYKHKNIEVFFAINNILNAKYAKFGSSFNDRNYPQPGLNFTGGFTVSY